MRKIIFLSVIAAALGGATLAEASNYRAPCTSTPASQWLSAQELAAKFEAQGYAVRKIELKWNCGEANLTDKNGVRTEVRFDPTTGTITSRRDHLNRQYRHDDDDRR
jgi:hypothetical protein